MSNFEYYTQDFNHVMEYINVLDLENKPVDEWGNEVNENTGLN